jgi:16S rRNA C967 or C1407 C5-methylase (RsmB/RsmF family)/NOL1/NOP2/fmu family ribosome biogenesis protein
MIPEEFKKRIHSQKYIDTVALLKALEDTSPASIRINPLKWKMIPSDSEPVPWCDNGYYLESRPSYTLDPLFHSGCYYPQEASGMFLEEVIKNTGPSSGLRILDLCGAPGGKSTHLSEIIGQDNLLVANEAVRSRAVVLAETVTKWGSGNTIVTQNDPASFGKLAGYFDIINVDAPCSGEGMFRNDIARREWSVGNTIHCAERQKRILMDVWPSLKENGVLIYSTCTFNPGENEENIKWLTDKKNAESIYIGTSAFKGITEIDFEGVYGYGFYPGKIRGEGFFISAIRKTGKQEMTGLNARKGTDLRPRKADFVVAADWTHFPENRLFKWNEELFAVPCELSDFLNLYRYLKVIKAGTKVFTVKNNSFLPSHELALSFQLKTHAFPKHELSLAEALSFMRRDNFILNDSAKGWNIVTYKDVNIGFVNNIGKRVNNYFPVDWRIRMKAPEAGKENIINWIS